AWYCSESRSGSVAARRAVSYPSTDEYALRLLALLARTPRALGLQQRPGDRRFDGRLQRLLRRRTGRCLRDIFFGGGVLRARMSHARPAHSLPASTPELR